MSSASIVVSASSAPVLSSSGAAASPSSSAPASPSVSIPIASSSSNPVVSNPSAPSSVSTAPPGSSVAPPSSSSSPIASPSVLTSASISVSQSTLVSTSNGVAVTQTIQVTSTIPAGATITPSSTASNSAPASNSHAGAIAGGVVGGVAALLIAGFLLWFFNKRSKERRLQEEFDGNFDPGRTTGPTLPRMSIAGTPGLEEGATGPLGETDDGVGGRLAGSDIGAGVVTPFPASAAYHQQPYAQQPQMAQYGNYPASSVSGYDDMHSPTANNGFYYPGASSTAPSVVPPPSSNGSSGGYYSNPMSAKEREVRESRFSVANPTGMHMPMPAPSTDMPNLPNPHSPAGSAGSGGVVVHTDGGRVLPPDQDQPMREIPPTYDSIAQ
ncbi:unnamed protein product [Mycena citricolor]|uniref:Uncharacterized protein n=1 Tax=Mycena citricolor TaxID=2018698 RepID=A0AAD2HHZ0_9AGAR|nr:unnamed protein product [Mycena citricolor]CAK5275135.1 unnamed protein product [Mycena citricolor]